MSQYWDGELQAFFQRFSVHACKAALPRCICPGRGRVMPDCSGFLPHWDGLYQVLSHIFEAPAFGVALPRCIYPEHGRVPPDC